MRAGGYIAIVVLVIIVISGIAWYINGLNRVVRLHESVSAAWAQVETQLQRRYDLIPNLVNTVKGYAGHEEELFSEITRLRSQWAGAGTTEAKIENAQAMEGALGRLMVVVENYPDLKANQNMLAVQEELASTENKISFARQFYNDSVMKYNTKIQQVPAKAVAGMCNFKEEDFFEIEEGEAREPVEVQF